MPTYYVREAIFEISNINHVDDPESLSVSRGSDGSYMVQSKKLRLTRSIAVFRQPNDARKSFQQWMPKLTEGSRGNEKVNLWEIEAFTRKGAAKKSFRGKGTLVSTAQLSDEALKKKKIEEAKGQFLLAAFEAGVSNETLTEISNKMDKN